MAELRVKGTGTLKLFESDNTSSVTIASPASLGGDRTITLPDASVTLASGTMLATDGSGASLTALNASELGSGTVPTARLGSGTASSSTVLYGDQTYKAEPGGGKVLQVVSTSQDGISDTTTSTSFIGTGLSVSITPASTSNKVFIIGYMAATVNSDSENAFLTVERDGTNLADTTSGFVMISDPWSNIFGWNTPCPMMYLDSPSSTSSLTYEVNIRSRYGAAVSYGVDANVTMTLAAIEIDGT